MLAIITNVNYINLVNTFLITLHQTNNPLPSNHTETSLYSAIFCAFFHETADWRHIAAFHPTCCCKGKPPLARTERRDRARAREKERFKKKKKKRKFPSCSNRPIFVKDQTWRNGRSQRDGGGFNPCYLAWSKLVVAEIHGARVCVRVYVCAWNSRRSSIRTKGGRGTHGAICATTLLYTGWRARTRVRIYLVAAFCFPRSYRRAALRRRICDLGIRRGRRDGALKMWHIAMKAYAFALAHPLLPGINRVLSENKVWFIRERKCPMRISFLLLWQKSSSRYYEVYETVDPNKGLIFHRYFHDNIFLYFLYSKERE